MNESPCRCPQCVDWVEECHQLLNASLLNDVRQTAVHNSWATLKVAVEKLIRYKFTSTKQVTMDFMEAGGERNQSLYKKGDKTVTNYIKMLSKILLNVSSLLYVYTKILRDLPCGFWFNGQITGLIIYICTSAGRTKLCISDLIVKTFKMVWYIWYIC